MATEIKTKICGSCDTEKPLTEYYRRIGNKYRHICKVCDNIKRKQYPTNTAYIHHRRKNNFDKLSQEQQANIRDDIATMKITDVAIKYGINRKTMYGWKYKGLI